MHKKFSRNFMSAFIIQGLGAFLILLADIFAARIMGIDDYGLFSSIIAVVAILSLFGTAGLNQALLRYIPSYLATKKPSELVGIIRFSKLGSLLISISVTGSAAGLFYLIDSKYRDSYAILLVGLLAVPFNVQSSICQSVIRSLDRVGLGLFPEFIFRPLFFIGTLIYLQSSLAWTDAGHVVTIYSLAAALTFLLALGLQLKSVKTSAKIQPTYHVREWMGTAGSLLMMIGFGLIASRLAVVVLAMGADSRAVGLFSAASKISDAVAFPLVVVVSASVHMISSLYSQNKTAELQSVIDMTLRRITLISVPFALIILFFGKVMLNLFGKGFSDAYGCLLVLTLGQLVNALVGPVGYLMTMSGNHLSAAKVLAFASLFNLILCVLLIPTYSSMGAALAVSFSNILTNLLMLRLVKSRVSINPSFIKSFLK